MRVGPVVPDGVLIGYGDYGANTGPIDILAVSPGGVVTTLLAAFDTEQTINMRELDGAVYIPAVDPKTNTSAQIATNETGDWDTITAQPDGVGVAVHLFDVTLDPTTGELLGCGSRGPDTAFVWRRGSGGRGVEDDWVEDLAHEADGGGFNRFYGFRHEADGTPVVTTTRGSPAYYRLDASDGWVAATTVTLVPEPLRGVALDGSRWVTNGTELRLIPPPA